MASYAFQTPPRTSGGQRFNNGQFNPNSQPLGDMDLQEQIAMGYEPPAARPISQSYNSGQRNQDPYRQSGYDMAGGVAGAGMVGVDNGYFQVRAGATPGHPQRSAGSRGNFNMGQSMGRQSGDKTRQSNASTENLPPIPRAAVKINELLNKVQKPIDLDLTISQDAMNDYDILLGPAWAPFKRTGNFHFPDAIFEQFNRTQCYTMVGIFSEIGQAWTSIDNKLYMWDYATGGQFQGYEEQPNTITCVKLLRPRQGVLKDEINYVLVIGTTLDVFMIGVQAVPNAKQPSITEITMYNMNMSVNTKGIDVSVIAGTEKGRIFFGGKTNNDVYELIYRPVEGWFRGQCSKFCHTSQGIASFAPKLPISLPSLFGKSEDVEHVVQLVVDDTRSLLYTLSSTSNIRAFYYSQENNFSQRIAITWPQIHRNVIATSGESHLLRASTQIVSISPVPTEVARRTHLIATTSTGVRLYLSALAAEYSYDILNTMQVVQIRMPPPLPETVNYGREFSNNQSSSLTPTQQAKIIAPGYFFCVHANIDSKTDHNLFMSAPDTARMATAQETLHGRQHLLDNGTDMNLESRAEAIEVVVPPYMGGNEANAQFDTPPAEFAVLTNRGVQIFKRRRLVEIFAAAIRYGAYGAEAEVRRFFKTYGRAEGCVTALAVACGADTDSSDYRGSRVTDQEVVDLARKFFIEFGGKPSVDNVYDAATLPSSDNVRLSGRHDGIAIYVARIIRKIWKSPMIDVMTSPGGVAHHESKVPKSRLFAIQGQLQNLAKFLDTNKSFIDGLSGADQLLRVGSKHEEAAHQAEYKGLYAMTQLIGAIIEGIAFALVLFESNLDDIVASLTPQQRAKVKTITYEELFTSSASGSAKELAKELVTAIVNMSIVNGMEVDTVAEALRKRCGSFCSADDVIIFKAVEALKKAGDEPEVEGRNRWLAESLKLFQQAAASLTMDNLRDTVNAFMDLSYYPGAVRLALETAKALDRGNQALGYLNDGSLENDGRAAIYKKRRECYQFVFDALEKVDAFVMRSSDAIDGIISEDARMQEETWAAAKQSDDEVFLHQFYDWLFDRKQADLLLTSDSRTALDYLQRKSAGSLPHAELLWQYFARKEDFFQAASVLCKLARADYPMPLQKRLELLSRARGLCNSNGPIGSRQRMTDLSHQVQEELDVAVVQDEVMRKISEDDRISDVKKQVLLSELNAQLISLSDLYNRFAEPYGYTDVCLAIFQSADYRGPTEIRKCWETLISQVHEKTVRQGEIQPFEAVADTIRRLGHKFSLSEYIFPPNELVPLLEVYALERQRDIGPPTWIMDSLLEAGVQPEVLLRILDDMYWRNEIPFQGSAKKRLVRDAVFVADKWFNASLKGSRHVTGSTQNGFRKDLVLGILEGYVKNGLEMGPERQRLERLVMDINRRML